MYTRGILFHGPTPRYAIETQDLVAISRQCTAQIHTACKRSKRYPIVSKQDKGSKGRELLRRLLTGCRMETAQMP